MSGRIESLVPKSGKEKKKRKSTLDGPIVERVSDLKTIPPSRFKNQDGFRLIGSY